MYVFEKSTSTRRFTARVINNKLNTINAEVERVSGEIFPEIFLFGFLKNLTTLQNGKIANTTIEIKEINGFKFNTDLYCVEKNKNS